MDPSLFGLEASYELDLGTLFTGYSENNEYVICG